MLIPVILRRSVKHNKVYIGLVTLAVVLVWSSSFSSAPSTVYKAEFDDEVITFKSLGSVTSKGTYKLPSIATKRPKKAAAISVAKKNLETSTSKDPNNPYRNVNPEQVRDFFDHAIETMDNFIDEKDSETYKGFKDMMAMWNPKASKWASQASSKYRKLLPQRQSFPPAWKALRDQESTFRTVKIEECGCKRKVKGHKNQMLYDGTEANSTVSTCSKHSFLRGFKQRVRKPKRNDD